jgi:hypothetical protein
MDPLTSSNPRTKLFELNLFSPAHSHRLSIRNRKTRETPLTPQVTPEWFFYDALENPNPVRFFFSRRSHAKFAWRMNPPPLHRTDVIDRQEE